VKILLISDKSIADGGEELRMESHRAALRRRGHEVRIFSSDVVTEGKRTFAEHTCKGNSHPRMQPILATANPWAYLSLRTLLAQWAPDVVHVNSFLMQLSPLILPLLNGIPSIFNVAWYKAVCPRGTKMMPDGSACRVQPGAICLTGGCVTLRDWPFLLGQYQLWRSWSRCFDAIVANSRCTQTYLDDAGVRPVEIIWNGVPAVALSEAKDAHPTVTFAGRLVAEKGLDTLIEAFTIVNQIVPDAELLVMGDGSGKEHYQRMIDALSLSTRIRMLGHVARTEVQRIGGRAWVHVVPSTWDEPFGLSAAEALMRGVPVVASKKGGLVEVVKDGETGFLVPASEPKPLADAILKIITDRRLADVLARKAREDALERFCEEKIVDRWLELYLRVIANKR
jgi:glycosyltransferase involved in cell wall biosynthesis